MFTGEMARKRMDSVAKKSDALPNLSTERHSSKFKHGSRTQRLSSKGNTYKAGREWDVGLVSECVDTCKLTQSVDFDLVMRSLTSRSVSRVSSVRLR